MQAIGSPEKNIKKIVLELNAKGQKWRQAITKFTNQIVGRDNDTAHKEDCTGDTIMASKDHIIDNRFVD